MSLYFADTSALAKRYIPEVGSVWVQGWLDPASGHITIISALSTVEFISLLARRQRKGTYPPPISTGSSAIFASMFRSNIG